MNRESAINSIGMEKFVTMKDKIRKIIIETKNKNTKTLVLDCYDFRYVKRRNRKKNYPKKEKNSW